MGTPSNRVIKSEASLQDVGTSTSIEQRPNHFMVPIGVMDFKNVPCLHKQMFDHQQIKLAAGLHLFDMQNSRPLYFKLCNIHFISLVDRNDD